MESMRKKTFNRQESSPKNSKQTLHVDIFDYTIKGKEEVLAKVGKKNFPSILQIEDPAAVDITSLRSIIECFAKPRQDGSYDLLVGIGEESKSLPYSDSFFTFVLKDNKISQKNRWEKLSFSSKK